VKVVVIGGTGMLGSMLVDVLSRIPDMDVFASFRGSQPTWTKDVRWFWLGNGRLPPSIQLSNEDWIVNAAGKIRHVIDEGSSLSVLEAIEANTILPFKLAATAGRFGASLLQIATDCVFSGKKEGYDPYFEIDEHDPRDVYGRTKSLGEVYSNRVHNLRCSIIGPEPGTNRGLLEWFLSQPACSEVKGFRNHFWNGITTLAFAKIAAGIIRSRLELPELLHVVPSDGVSKEDLLHLFRKHFDRMDVVVRSHEHEVMVKRFLATGSQYINRILWKEAGYEEVPSIKEMVEELASFNCRFRNWREG